MPKLCNAEGCYNPRWGKGYCKYHQNLRTDKKEKAISPLADKRAEELALYRTKREKYLKENTGCEVKECNNDSTHIHHKNGRNGARVHDHKYFMAVCNGCHPQKIHENPEWARENGYLI